MDQKNQIDVVGAELLFEEHQDLALLRARQLNRYVTSVRGNFDELHNEMLFSLWKSALSFKPSAGVPFKPFAVQRLTWDAWEFLYPRRKIHGLTFSAEVFNEDLEGEDNSQFLEIVMSEDTAARDRDFSRVLDRVEPIYRAIHCKGLLTSTERQAMILQFCEARDREEDRRRG